MKSAKKLRYLRNTKVANFLSSHQPCNVLSSMQPIFESTCWEKVSTRSARSVRTASEMTPKLVFLLEV